MAAAQIDEACKYDTGKDSGRIGRSRGCELRIFGAISGSGVATTAAIGGVMGAEMVKKG